MIELESLFQLHLLDLMGFSREVGVALVGELARPNLDAETQAVPDGDSNNVALTANSPS